MVQATVAQWRQWRQAAHPSLVPACCGGPLGWFPAPDRGALQTGCPESGAAVKPWAGLSVGL